MIEAVAGDLPAFSPLLAQCFAEAGIEKRFTVDECLSWAQGGLESKKTRLFVDDIGKPTYLLYALRDAPSMFPREKPFTVLLVYALPEARNFKTFKRIDRTIQAEADRENASVIYVSEWCYGSMPSIGQLWEQLGYKLQEKIFMKEID